MRSVYVPCKLPDGLGQPPQIEDADGVPLAIGRTRIDWLNGVWYAVGKELRDGGNGRHLVKFDGGEIHWVRATLDADLGIAEWPAADPRDLLEALRR